MVSLSQSVISDSVDGTLIEGVPVWKGAGLKTNRVNHFCGIFDFDKELSALKMRNWFISHCFLSAFTDLPSVRKWMGPFSIVLSPVRYGKSFIKFILCQLVANISCIVLLLHARASSPDCGRKVSSALCTGTSVTKASEFGRCRECVFWSETMSLYRYLSAKLKKHWPDLVKKWNFKWNLFRKAWTAERVWKNN